MKVVLAIDPIRFPLTGIGRYTYELAKGLQAANMQSLWFLRGGQLVSADTSIRDATSDAWSATTSRWRRVLGRSKLARDLYQSYEREQQTRKLSGMGDHIFHGPNYYLPDAQGPGVVTVHDLSIFLRPQDHPAARVASMSTEIERSLGRANAIITDTEHTRREVMQHFGLPGERVFAVHLASGSEFHPRSHSQLAASLVPFGLVPQGYCLFTGTIEPRKNLETLLDAYSRLPSDLRKRWPLVIIGYQGWLSQVIHAKMKKAEAEGWLRYLGYVSQDLLPSFMAGARLFAFPSHYEGFGLPLVEAMACGVPVVSSNASCLPEVGGMAPAYHQPSDVEGLSELLERGLCDEAWREEARSRGLERAKAFSWQRCAQETMAVYGAVSGR